MLSQALSNHHPRLIFGETFYSWISRAQNQGRPYSSYRFRSILELHFSKWQSCNLGRLNFWEDEEGTDFEFDQSSDLFMLASDVLNISHLTLQCYFSAGNHWLTKLPYRQLCCRDCFRESMGQCGQPAWRKVWCYATTSVCQTHRRFLTRPFERAAPHARIWAGYIHSIQWHDASDGTVDRMFSSLALKVQIWVQTRVASAEARTAIFSLYGLLLSKKTAFAPEGMAASTFRKKPPVICRTNLSIQDRIAYGVDDSDSYQRGGALIMLGWVLGLINDPELLKLASVNRFARAAFPRSLSLELFGQMVTRVMNAGEVEFLLNRLNGLKTVADARADEFLRGVSNSLRSFPKLRRSALVHRPLL